MDGDNLNIYRERVAAFGWETILIDGHDLGQILSAYQQALASKERPVMIIARTIKGKGVSFVEDRNGWHGKALKPEELERALLEMGPVDATATGAIAPPPEQAPAGRSAAPAAPFSYPRERPVATRRAYGNALKRIHPAFPQLVVLDGEV